MFLLALLIAAETAPFVLHLQCLGMGERVRMNPVITQGAPNTYVPSRHSYSDSVQIEIVGAEGRIRVPRAMDSGWREGGENGWWQLRNIEVSENEINARFRINLLNNPRLRIDRLTGQIAITGRRDFSGQCEAFDPATVQRRF